MKLKKNSITAAQQDNFLPNLCSTPAVLSLLILGELLALALELGGGGIARFSWSHFGTSSLLFQWVILSSAGTICVLRPYISRSAAFAAACSFSIVLIYGVGLSALALWVSSGFSSVDFQQLLTNGCITAILSGVMLRYLYLQEQLSQQKRAELQARLEALQSRIRPHFLFNSLNSIASLIDIDPVAAEKLVVDLSRLFRSSLQKSGLIPIEQEIDICKRFASIEQVRLGSRLTLHWNIESLPANCQILNLLMQPLIENAIYHGIQPLQAGGTVKVEIRLVKGDVVIKVTNPRIPGSESKVLSVDKAIGETEAEAKTRGNGIAMANIRDRLAASYGSAGYLRLVKGATDFSVILRYPSELANEPKAQVDRPEELMKRPKLKHANTDRR
ncbi:MAG: two-component system sensor histidine kinase AlgZ [Flavobacteriales bacterium]|jgi:two-component system sensor histidine kinase AlgZ